MYNKWSDLSRNIQDSIIERVIYKHEDCDAVALEYKLRPSSLSRTIRKIKRRRGIITPFLKKEKVNSVVSQDSQGSQDLSRPSVYKTSSDRGANNGIHSPNSVELNNDIGFMNVIRLSSIHRHDLLLHISAINNEIAINPNDRTLYINLDKPLRILEFSDPHFPYQDRATVDCFLRAAEKLPHDVIINGGDTMEMYGLSQYGKDPTLTFTKNLKIEREAWTEFANNLNSVSPNSEKFIIFGNHMVRYLNWLNNNQSVLMLEEMQIDNLMRLRQLGWQPNVAEIFINGDYTNLDFPNPEIIFHHGTLARRHAGASARGESENMGYISSVSGHVHRLSVSYKKTLQKQVLMAEAGTLRNLKPGYMYRPDWQNGFLYITHVPGGLTYCQPILIQNGVAYYEGERI